MAVKAKSLPIPASASSDVVVVVVVVVVTVALIYRFGSPILLTEIIRVFLRERDF